MREVKRKGKRREERREWTCKARLGVTCVSSGLTSSLSSSTQSSNNPLLPPPKEKLKAFFWKKGSLLRLLLFTFGRTAIGGEFKHRKRPLLTGRAADRPGRLAAMLGVCTFPIGVQPWGPDSGHLPPHQATKQYRLLGLLYSSLPWGILILKHKDGEGIMGGWRRKGEQKEEKRFISQISYNLISSLAWKI